ncbi:MAG: hypothetical protein ACJLS2_00470 [Microcella pacifica]
MGEKSARKNTAKTAASKTLKEKRVAKADKKAAGNRMESSDAVLEGREALEPRAATAARH